MDDRSSQLQFWIEALQAGNLSAREQLFTRAYERLRKLAGKMLHDFQRVRRWEETDDICNEASIKLWKALQEISPRSVREFLGLAAVQIRRVLIDLARHYDGPQGPGRRHHTPDPGKGSTLEPLDKSEDQQQLARWTALHEAVEQLPAEEREVFGLHWYQGLTHLEAAEILEVSVDTIKRRWQAARWKLYEALGGDVPAA
jgi:RNA polymerase sigma factor (TIGR02999 family)